MLGRIDDLGEEGRRLAKTGTAVAALAEGGWKTLTEQRTALWALGRQFGEVVEADQLSGVLSDQGRALLEEMREKIEVAHNALDEAVALGRQQA